MVLIPYSNIWSYPKALTPHNGHGRFTNRRYPEVRLGDVATVRTENTIPRLTTIHMEIHYNVNLARQVAMGSQLRLRFEQKAKLLKKSFAQVARRDKRIQARELEIKNLEALLETEADMKKAAEDKSDGLIKELEDMHARFLDLQVSHEHLSQQVASLKEQVSGEEKLKAAFEEFKRYEDDRVERRCAELDALSIDLDEELYPHMLTAITGRRWVIGHGLLLDAMKCGESLDMRQAFTDLCPRGLPRV
nr:hypothetical protein [Tanacetum cinerariifolium]